ncbi:MAG: copper amine oxidase N-terminal domain-containing protein, partial [Oscillospiraceae bacterium]
YGRTIVIGCNEFSVKYNGNAVSFPDAQPFVDASDRTLVPVRFVAETMGANVTWNGATATATIVKGKNTVNITINDKNLDVAKDGAKSTVAMDTQAVLKDGRTFVPVRFVAEALDAWVGYSDIYNTAQIYSDVLKPIDITRLRGYEDALRTEKFQTREEWLERAPQTEYFAGSGVNGFSNANEWTLRTEYGDSLAKRSTFKGEKCGLTYDKNVQPTVDYAKLVMNEGIKGIEDYYNKDGLLDVKLFTDLSCVFDSRHENLANSCIRGCLLIHVPDNADIPAIQAKYGYGDIKAGEIYKNDVEVTVEADIQTGLVKCYKFNILK